ncbi:hypothetical protein CF336_g7777 [Tilletia laevis]|uniref:Uncharacterized protein n=1 Tax=Tilletia caries TaxID=13290 RepID=A0A177TYG3_9BASI|nr:hypothetical protein CF336_g7777 [Tilletia laevis]KAE8185857.1 hypothetical protein CF328_g7415 [Tilletia controversa]KAE8187790.1 hypothetical protein CF335_g7070 [Tilletia laevis]KAE8246379.1 hypothetical protein A4X03_0g7270 [Tilletia caries]
MSRTAPSTARPTARQNQEQQLPSSSIPPSPSLGSATTASSAGPVPSTSLAAVVALAAQVNPPPPPTISASGIDIVVSSSSREAIPSVLRSLSPNPLKRPFSPATQPPISLQPPPPSSCSSPGSSRSSSLSNQNRTADHYNHHHHQRSVQPEIIADSGYPSGPSQAHPLPAKPDAPLPARPSQSRDSSASRSLSRPRSGSNSQSRHNYPQQQQQQQHHHHHQSQLHHLHQSSPASSTSSLSTAYPAGYPGYGPYNRSSHSISSSSARSHPSPATSLSSASTSSLRTPPDLLLNPSSAGASAVAAISGGGILADKDKRYYHLLHQQDSQQQFLDSSYLEPTRTLSMDAIKQRLKLIDSLGKSQGANIKDALPRAPHGRNGTQISSDTKLSAPKPVDQATNNNDRMTESTGSKKLSEGMQRGKESNRPRPSPDRLRDSTDSADPSSVSRKRKPRGDESDPDRTPTIKKARGSSTPSPASASASASLSSSQSRSISRTPSERNMDGGLPPKNWTLELFNNTCLKYKARGRELKHSGDRRARDGSDGRSRQEAVETAALEHTDAILHYVYAFWCDDQARALTARKGESVTAALSSTAAASHCNPGNWTSLFLFLEFAIKAHNKTGWSHLAGLCKLIEAMVRHLVLCHEQRQLNARMSKLNANAQTTLPSLLRAGAPGESGGRADEEMEETGPPTPGGPESHEKGSSSVRSATGNGSNHSSASALKPNAGSSSSESASAAAIAANANAAAEAHLKELSEVTESLSRLTRESERISLLFTEARSALSYSVLREHFPLTWAACIASDLDASSVSTTMDLEPDDAIRFGSEGRISLARFAWPIEYNSGLGHVVCFGRALVAELGRGRRLGYVPAPVMSAPSME